MIETCLNSIKIKTHCSGVEQFMHSWQACRLCMSTARKQIPDRLQDIPSPSLGMMTSFSCYSICHMKLTTSKAQDPKIQYRELLFFFSNTAWDISRKYVDGLGLCQETITESSTVVKALDLWMVADIRTEQVERKINSAKGRQHTWAKMTKCQATFGLWMSIFCFTLPKKKIYIYIVKVVGGRDRKGLIMFGAMPGGY